MKKILLLAVMLLLTNPSFAAIQSAKVSKNSIPAVQEQEFTLGAVQRQVKVGASQDEVAIALGSPNIVTQDAEGKETWIYDKVSSSITDRNKNESMVENSMYTRYAWNNLLTLVTLGLIDRGVKPELLPPSEDISKLKRKLENDEKKILKEANNKLTLIVDQIKSVSRANEFLKKVYSNQ